MRDKFDLCLPHINTLRKWYSRLDCEPGFTSESFNTIATLSERGPVYIYQLQSLQQSEGLHLANKLSARHIDFKTQNMKVRLAAQLLSRSVGVAIDACNKDLKIPEFQKSEATVESLLYVNDIFDIFNSKN